jgi:thiol-disulfide isomerase/thioredoxin
MNKIVMSILAISLFLGCEARENNSTNTQQQSKIQEKQQTATTTTKNESNKTAPKAIEFTLKTVEGKEFHLKEIDNGFEFKELKDRPVFLVFFGHRCPPCMREIPRLVEISKKHKDLAIIGLEVQGLGGEALKDFIKSRGIDYDIVPLSNSMNFVNYIQARAGWSGAIPFLIGFNKKGKVVIVHIGGLFKEQLEQVYQELIK